MAFELKRFMAKSVVFAILLSIAVVWAQQPKGASAVPVLPSDIPAIAGRYSVGIMGNPAGQQAVWTAPDGSVQDHHTALDPTLSVFEDMFLTRAGEIPRGFQPIDKRLPPQVRRGLLSSGLTPPVGMDERYKKSFAKMVELVGVMYRAGIPIEDGADSMAGFAFHRELELDVMAGIPPSKVLQNATLNSARIMSLDRDLGSVTPGKLADLTLVDGDPMANISAVRKTALVVKDGVLYRPAELYSALGVEP